MGSSRYYYFDEKEDVYSKKKRAELVEEDELTSQEETFMEGYEGEIQDNSEYSKFDINDSGSKK